MECNVLCTAMRFVLRRVWIYYSMYALILGECPYTIQATRTIHPRVYIFGQPLPVFLDLLTLETNRCQLRMTEELEVEAQSKQTYRGQNLPESPSTSGGFLEKTNLSLT